jgi:hypothetical protein
MNQFTLEKRLRMLKILFLCFALAIVILLAACSASTPNTNPNGGTVGANVQSPTSTKVPTTATATNTPEPTATVEEFPAAGADSFYAEFWPAMTAAGKANGCNVSYEEGVFPKTFLIPLTTDANGNVVRAVTQMNLCGDGTDPPYLVGFTIGDGFPTKWATIKAFLPSPTNAFSLWKRHGWPALPPYLVGALTPEMSEAFGGMFQCMFPSAEGLGLKPKWAVSIGDGLSDTLYKSATLGRISGDSETLTYQDCK